ncbi:MAG: type IV-A pilus assembly ATPase PilB [Gammaproteobacteria bacterium]|nr:type IV-A pilus assembly ATPase PilB [Gammaproteobacteria bacterium]
MASETLPLSGLARRLVQDGILAADAAQNATEQARKAKVPFVSHLVQQGLATGQAIASSASQEFGVPLFDLDCIDPDSIPKDLVADKLIRAHHALPLIRRGVRLFVAVSDPTNLQGLDEIKFQTGVNTEPVLVEENKLAAMIDKHLSKQEEAAFDDIDDSDLEDLDLEAVDEDSRKEEVDPGKGADETPIVRFVNKMLLDAIKGGSSDIHFEPYEKVYRVRFRTDGILHEVAKPPQTLGVRISARLKVMSQMDISERRVPQDGRIKMKISKNRAIDFRVNTLPTLFGEKVVLRILDPSSAKMGIDALGYEEDQKKLYMDALDSPQGMILVTGPTGSGKTVSLYTGLNILNTTERNIATAEDPVEINLEGINQVNVNAKVGLDFAAALRSFLRQDPDIVMVGEIRDLETANIAIKAAQTGHMVLSTLHTNSAPETLTRLRNMGVPSFNIATSVNLIIAQRLARRLCNHCKQRQEVPREALLELGFLEDEVDGIELFEPNLKGCEKCTAGYKGRVGVYEVVKITKALQRIIMEDGNAIEIAEAARAEGFNDLHRSGLIKAKQGVTSLAEVNRVTMGH